METPLLPHSARRRGRILPALLAAAAGCFALCALAYLSHSERTALLTTVTQNCDGSVDITTTSMLPCATGVLPGALPVGPTVYTSYAPLAAPVPPVAPVASVTSYGAALPVAPNVYQYPTVWSGDHVISAGQPEWAAEDAAQHALNLANWRIKLLQAKKVQAQLAKEVMSIGTSSVRISRPYKSRTKKVVKRTKKTKKVVKPKKTSKKLSQEAQLMSVEKSVLTLAQETRKAIGALAGEVDKKGGKGKSAAAADNKLDRILTQMKEISEGSADDSDDADDNTTDNNSASNDSSNDDSSNDDDSDDDSDNAETDQ